jgi:hypothetical protein
VNARKNGNESHGMSKSPEYAIWAQMKDRCRNPNNPYYHAYGGRGITVCDEWLNSFMAFYESVGARPEGDWQIERVNNSLGYCPGNVVWASPKAQSRNTRKNTMLEFRGETKCISEWAEITGIRKNAICGRLERGWSIEEALTLGPNEKPLPSKKITFNGQTKTVPEWAETLGMTRQGLRYRLRRMPLEQALVSPKCPGLGLNSQMREAIS